MRKAFEAAVLDSHLRHGGACVMSQNATGGASPVIKGWRCVSVPSSSLQVRRRMKPSMAVNPTESTLPQPGSCSIPYFSLHICRVLLLFLILQCFESYSGNNLGELEQTSWPMLAGHRSGCLPRFWLWLSWREWGRGSERHSAAPHKQTSASG